MLLRCHHLLWTAILLLLVVDAAQHHHHHHHHQSSIDTTKHEDACREIADAIEILVNRGRLSEARWVAWNSTLLIQPEGRDAVDCRSTFAMAFSQAVDRSVDEQGHQEFLAKVKSALQPHQPQQPQPRARRDASDCTMIDSAWMRENPHQTWDACCSILPQQHQPPARNSVFGGEASLLLTEQVTTISSDGAFDRMEHHPSSRCASSNPCCELFLGAPAHLRLPALHEPALAVRVGRHAPIGGRNRTTTTTTTSPFPTTMGLEQDGYLRLFDVSGILWPSGYLLMQCVSNPEACGVGPEFRAALAYYHSEQEVDHHPLPLAIELGAGIGAPSTTLALQLKHGQKRVFPEVSSRNSPMVVATDISPPALALTLANAHFHGLSDLVEVASMNHTNVTSVRQVHTKFFASDTARIIDKWPSPTGFAMVLGSSLQAFFENSDHSDSILWNVMDQLLDRHNPHAMALLVHVRSYNPLQPPDDASFTLLKRISGDVFGMQTRAGESSDFEICVFQRKRI